MNLTPLDYINLLYIWTKSYPQLRDTWSAPVDDSRESAIRVNYGHDNVSGTEEHVFGGMIKLQDLNTEFPHYATHPNILYLVSSALPYFPVRMAKMAKRAGAKIVLNQNGVAYPGWYGRGWERQNKPMKELLKLSDHVIYQSDFCKLSADKFLGKCIAKHDILYNPVNTEVFRPIDNQKHDDRPPTILLAGSHWSLYRPKLAVEVLYELKKRNFKARLKIAGRYCWSHSSAAAAEQIADVAKELGVARDFEYVGPYTQREAVTLLQSCSVLLHTKYNDPCPRLVVEAMACGLPIVYSATGGVPELVGDAAGIGIPGPLDWNEDRPPDARELADAVISTLINREVYSRAARLRAIEKFDVHDWLVRHREIFKQICSA